MSQKTKMCKSPKNIVYAQSDKIEYENMNTNCTIVGSNNLHLVKKPQLVTSMSPAYSNPSPGYPPSPYSSPASLKSPSPLNMKPPTPQPNSIPVMQIIHNSHPVISRNISQPQNVIKLKPPLNILPKPSASPQQSPKPSVSPQIVLPANHQQATIMPTPQPLLLNQMPMLTPGVQYILRPHTAKLPAQMQQTPQGLILQPGGQQLLQLQPPRSQPMVRLLSNGVGLPTTTYVTQVAPQNNIQVTSTQSTPPKKKSHKKKKQKLDLANIMKLSGIGDDDDVQFESDTSQSESEHNVHSQPATPQPQPTPPTIVQSTPSQVVQSQGTVDAKQNSNKVNNLQLTAVPQTINTTGAPVVQLLNHQTFQGGTQTATAQPTSIPYSPFLTPNFTINNGLMVQRSGGFRLALGEDGRLVLQHDPTLNQDIQSQLLLQNIFGLNGGLVLQPSIDQQIHSQTVQTIQQQSVQTIQQQTVQSQTIQTVQHQIVQPQTIQSIQSQLQGQIQSLLQQQNLGSQSIAIQPQNITIQPQGLQSMQVSQPISIQSQLQSQPITIQSQAPINQITLASQSQPICMVTQTQPVNSQIPNIQSTSQQQIHSQSAPVQISQANHMISLTQPSQILSQNPTSNLTSGQQQVQQQHQQTQPQPIQPQVQQRLQQPQQIQQTQQIQQQQQPQQIQPQQLQQSQQIQQQPFTPLSQSNVGSQPVLKVQPFQKSQPPVQTVHPIHHHNSQQPQQQPSQSTSYVVNLTPEQLEQLKRDGQLTVNGQTIFMQRTSTTTTKIEEKKTPPKIKPIKKTIKLTAIREKLATVNSLDKVINNVIKDSGKSGPVCTAQRSPNKICQVTQASVQTQHSTTTTVPAVSKPQPAAIIHPSVQPITQIQPKVQIIAQPKVSKEIAPNHPEVDKFLGQLVEDTTAAQKRYPNKTIVTKSVSNVTTPQNNVHNSVATSIPQPRPPLPIPPQIANSTQRVHTIQLTPQKQQHLKSIQVQIQALSSRLVSGDSDTQEALKLLFQEQQKILASGKLLPPDKVFYHNNQLVVKNDLVNTSNSRHPITTTNNSAVTNGPQVQIQPPTVAQTQQKLIVSSASEIQVQNAITTVKKNILPIVQPPSTSSSSSTAASSAPSTSTPIPTIPAVVPSTPSIQSSSTQRFMPLYTKVQLIEQQLNTDQNGAVKPDIQTPFKNKADACKRLIRYHCFDQPVLSQKDLNKADEIFELTAKHFIDKFGRMVDKYRFLLHKESQRHVQTSELMMLDRMFLAEEQQSLIKLRQEMDEKNLEMQQSTQQGIAGTSAGSDERRNEDGEDYDEWACIQRELGCIPMSGTGSCEDKQTPVTSTATMATTTTTTSASTLSTTTATSSNSQSMKRSSSADSRLETLKKFRVDKHCKKMEVVSTNCTKANYQSSNTNVFTTTVVHGANYQSNEINQRAIQRTNARNMQTNQDMPFHHNSSIHSYSSNSVHHIQNPIQRVHNMHHQHVVHNQQLVQRNVQHYSSTQHIVQHITHTVHHTQQMHHTTGAGSSGSSTTHHHHHSSSIHSQNSYSSGNEELDNNDSIDEQVQSAIDSILNLQQNTSLDLDETVQSMLS